MLEEARRREKIRAARASAAKERIRHHQNLQLRCASKSPTGKCDRYGSSLWQWRTPSHVGNGQRRLHCDV